MNSYGFDEATAEWWVNKKAFYRWGTLHAESITFLFSDVLDANVSFALSQNSVDKFSVHHYSKIVINNISALFEDDELGLYCFLVQHGDKIIEFLFKHQKLPLKYLTDTCLKYCETNMYFKFTNFTELVEWLPCAISFNKDEIVSWCEQVIAEHGKIVDDYKKGKLNAINSLKGQVMKLSKGKADPQIVHATLTEKLK